MYRKIVRSIVYGRRLLNRHVFFFSLVSHSSYVSNLISFLSRFVRLPTEEVLRVESPFLFFIIIMILRFIRVCMLHSTFET